jgi:four helix bundle protein
MSGSGEPDDERRESEKRDSSNLRPHEAKRSVKRGGATSSKSHRNLRVWNEGMSLARICYEATSGFSREEVYGMTSQIRRAAVAVPANIAEGYGRETPKEFVRFLRISQGLLKELETHIMLASEVGWQARRKWSLSSINANS